MNLILFSLTASPSIRMWIRWAPKISPSCLPRRSSKRTAICAPSKSPTITRNKSSKEVPRVHCHMTNSSVAWCCGVILPDAYRLWSKRSCRNCKSPWRTSATSTRRPWRPTLVSPWFAPPKSSSAPPVRGSRVRWTFPSRFPTWMRKSSVFPRKSSHCAKKSESFSFFYRVFHQKNLLKKNSSEHCRSWWGFRPRKTYENYWIEEENSEFKKGEDFFSGRRSSWE